MKDRLTDAAYAAGWGLVKALPAGLAGRAFRLAADTAVRRNGRAVRRLRGNLRRVVGPDLPEDRFDALVGAAMRSYARYWLEAFRLPVQDPRHLARMTDKYVEGTQNFDEAYARGKGVIIVLPHSGNWDASAVWLVERGMPFTTVAERLKPESLYRRFVAFREGLGMEVVPLTGGPRSPSDILAERLRAGRVVCLVGDRDLTASGIEVDFFGEPARMPAGPALLAARTGAALLPADLWFEPEVGTHRLNPPVEIPEEGSLRDRVTAATQQVADAFARGIAQHPEDWHMVQRLWSADLPAPAARSGGG